MLIIDLNADLGEGMADDPLIMECISSVNIACGAHAGDEQTMQDTMESARRLKVAIGAHPSYPDKAHFGRRDLLGQGMGPEELKRSLVGQLDSLRKICLGSGALLRHVKVHGALYNRAASDPLAAAIVCEAVRETDPSLIIYGMPGSVLNREATRMGLRFIREGFCDRTYGEDGLLLPRSRPDALITDISRAARQGLALAKGRPLETANGKMLTQSVDSLCIHGDNPQALLLALTLREALETAGIRIAAL